MTTLTLNKLDVARAAAKAYREGRLSAQGPASACRYRDEAGCPCVIGAAIDAETAAAWDAINPLSGAGIDNVFKRDPFQTDDLDALISLQMAHDSWAQGASEAEGRLVDLLNDILPPEEKIDAALAACGEGL